MIYSLGGFKFESAVLPQTLKRSTDYNINAQERMGNYALLGANKKQKEEIEIACVTLPLRGAKNSVMDKLYALAREQKSYTLATGTGKVLGKFVITSIDEEQGALMPNGAFLAQNFTLKLIRDYNG
ncbi:MAG: phage tail protein [Campylobacteraceae bacterium]|jgi:phage protein U|nr:phage tail protein [Campylobacteraceae bacterium]